MRQTYKWKVILIAILLVLNVLGLGYLFIKGNGRLPSAPTPTPTPTVEPTVAPTPTPTPIPTPTPKTFDVDSDSSILRIVNKWRYADSKYVPSDLVLLDVTSEGDQYLRKEAAEQLEAMFEAAEKEKVYLKVISGYRSFDEQVELRDSYIKQFGETRTSMMDSYPGGSEHQLGLAVDIGNYNNHCRLQECFVRYASYPWLQAHAHEYGFIERYHKGKEDQTGISYSPWHWRYIGVEQAKAVKESGSTLEEYYGLLDNGDN